jgi:hypothetical protein
MRENVVITVTADVEQAVLQLVRAYGMCAQEARAMIAEVLHSMQVSIRPSIEDLQKAFTEIAAAADKVCDLLDEQPILRSATAGYIPTRIHDHDTTPRMPLLNVLQLPSSYG